MEADVSIDIGRLEDSFKTRFDEEMGRMMELCAASSCLGASELTRWKQKYSNRQDMEGVRCSLDT